VDRGASLTVEGWLEEEFRAAHSDGGGNVDNSLVGEGELHVLGGARGSLSLLFVPVLSDVAALLFDGSNDFLLSGRGERFSSLEEELLHVGCEDTSSDLHLLDGVGDRETFEDGNSVGNTITRIANETSGSSGGVKREDSLDLNTAILNLEGLEHYLDHLLSVGLGVSGSLSEHNSVALVGVDSEFVEEAVVPDLLHVFPGLNDTSDDRILQVEDTLLLHGLVSNILTLDVDTVHSSSLSGSSNDGWENGGWGFISSKTCLDHTGSVINNDSL